MSQQQPTNVYPYDPTMEYGPVIESPPNSSKLPGPTIIAIIVAVVIFVIVIFIISCLWKRRKDRHSMEVDQEAPPPEPTGINADEKMPKIASRERSVFEDGSTSHGGGGPAPPNFGGGYRPPPPNFGGGYGPPPPNFGRGYGPPPPNFGRGYGPPPHFGGGYERPPQYFYG